VRALAEDPGAALVALHDDVLPAFSAIATAPPARTLLLSHPEDDVVDALRRAARERPLPVIGVALAAELLYAGDGAEDRIRAWSALGEAPLDVVARELHAGGAPR
jgi:chemotaxis response regulator CheB